MSEKKLPATQQRLLKARKEGQLGISQEACKIVKLAVMAELAFATESAWRGTLGQVFDTSLLAASRVGRPMVEGALSAFTESLGLLIVIPIIAAVTAYAFTMIQTRFNVAPEALSKGFEKLDPSQNLQQLVSMQKMVPMLIGPFLLATVGWVCFNDIQGQLPELTQLYRLTPGQGWALAMQTMQQIVHDCLKILVVWAVFDIVLQRVLHRRQLRMDHEELKQERKDTQGDPKAKSSRRQMGRDLMAEQPVSLKPTAIAVNPEHIAVALAYTGGKQDVPVVVAKCSEGDATLLREYARRERIPIIKYVGLARQLYAIGRIGEPVPIQQLRAVALLYHAVQELHEQQAPMRGEVYEVDQALGAQMLSGTGFA